MNNNLKNYSVDPDPEVWQSINKDLRRKKVRTQATTGVLALSILATSIAAVVLWPSAQKHVATENVEHQASAQVAQTLPQEETQVESAEVTSTQTVRPEVAKTTESHKASLVTVEQLVATPIAEVVEQVKAVNANSVEAPEVVAKSEPKTVENEKAVAPVVTKPQVVAPIVEQSAPKQESVKANFNTNVPDTIVWIPNVFAPASDDPDLQQFRVRLNQPGTSISNFRLTIFNRNGHQVFSSHSIDNAWDGTYRGRALPQAAYVYVLYYTDKDGFQHQRKGSVTLVR